MSRSTSANPTRPSCLARLVVRAAAPFVIAACGSNGTSVYDFGDASGPAPAPTTQTSLSSGGGAETTSKACVSDSDCDNHDPCTSYTCVTTRASELSEGYCSYTPVDGGAACVPHTTDAASGSEGLAAVDPACASGASNASVYPPYVPLVPPDVPASCANGFEIGDATAGSTYTIPSLSPSGAPAVTLDIDFATYLEPDGVEITGKAADGSTYTVFDSCRLQTWNAADPTGGVSRPPDQTIRQFHADVKAGTTSLTLNFAGVVSPMYIQVLGLCDFAVTDSAKCTWWQAVSD